jgi:hypothetical protein
MAHVRRLNEYSTPASIDSNPSHNEETWRDVFCAQVDSGKYWKNLFKDNFEKEQFLTRSDASYIVKKAQADIIQGIIKDFEGNVNDSVINYLQNMIKELWAKDDSAIGMIVNGKQIK